MGREFSRRAGPAVLAGLLVLAGCVAGRVDMSVTGYLNPKAPPGPAGGKFYVSPNDEAPNQLLDAEVARKIEAVLRAKGGQIVSRAEATYVFSYDYGVGPGPTVTRSLPRYQPGEVATVPVRDASGRTVWVTVTTPGRTTYETYSQVTHRRWLIIRVLDARKLDQSNRTEAIWVGDTVSIGASSDLRTTLNYLIAGTLDRLWTDTGEAVKVSLPLDDPAALQLKQLSQ